MNLPLVTVIALIMAVVGVLMTVIGFSTTAWETATTGRNGYSKGLFMFCRTVCYRIQDAIVSDWLVATRAMVILGSLLSVACVMTLTLYIIKRQLKILHLLGMVCSFAAGFFVLVGIIIYATQRETTGPHVNLGWSFMLTVAGGVALGIAGGVILVDKLRG